MSEELPQEECKKEKASKGPAGAPAWMVTYSDLVTLLLTFFVLLLSMANMDPVRFTEASSSLKDAFGIHARPAHVEFAIPVLPSPPISKFTPMQQAMTTKVYERIKSQIQLHELSDEVHLLENDANSIILRVDELVLFQQGSATLLAKAQPILRNISDIIRPLPMQLKIEGHTDDIQIGQDEIGNWDLSVSRAVSVMRFFKQGELLQIDRLSAVGYGPERPAVPNIDENSRAKNRRVDFVLSLDSDDKPASATGQKSQTPL